MWRWLLHILPWVHALSHSPGAHPPPLRLVLGALQMWGAGLDQAVKAGPTPSSRSICHMETSGWSQATFPTLASTETTAHCSQRDILPLQPIHDRVRRGSRDLGGPGFATEVWQRDVVLCSVSSLPPPPGHPLPHGRPGPGPSDIGWGCLPRVARTTAHRQRQTHKPRFQ